MLNVALNGLLIPRFGICGAAIASLLTQIITNIFLVLAFRDTRKAVQLMGKALDPRTLVLCFRELLPENSRNRKPVS